MTQDQPVNTAIRTIINRRKESGDYGSYAERIEISLRRLMQLIKAEKSGKKIKCNQLTGKAIIRFAELKDAKKKGE